MLNLEEKTADSIRLIQKGEKLALLMQPEGYTVAFSGGKDSQAILELVKMANVKYKAVYNVTTIDPPENVYFIRNKYPEVEFILPKENFFKLVEKKGMPTMLIRYCCSILKESTGSGSVVVLGCRKDESRKRSNYEKVMMQKGKAGNRESKDLDQMEKLNFECVKGKDKIMIYPLLEWTELDVWKFIAKRGLPYNPAYDIANRVGCMFCPFSKKSQIDFYIDRYPKFYKKLIDSLNKFLSNDKRFNKNFKNGEDFLEWWKSQESIADYKAKKSQIEIPFQ